MINLFKIEFYKNVKTKYFWISNILYIIFLISIPNYINYFLDTSIQSKEGQFIKSTAKGVFLNNMWKTLIVMYSVGALFMFFTVMLSITREYKYKTIKQNIIDGLSKKEFFISKLFLIMLFSIFYTIIVGVIIYLTSYSYGKKHIDISEIYLLARYLLFLLNFLLFVFFVSFLFKSYHLALSFVFAYMLIIEPILSFIFVKNIGEKIIIYFPLNSLYRILPVDKNLSNFNLIVSIFYCLSYVILSYILFKKRDL